uniref:Uncharacterized protein n=1 Tax=Cyclophora tenuis TaxID=216820 RepID=A0A7S1D2H8_CYCTE|mmetsp:Transcript_19995/g.34155  ORF Transcript_19995/g.34155 Transcript_19995/m.34155 type:complete len:338 (+) Transcript_19995:145-1158(+)
MRGLWDDQNASASRQKQSDAPMLLKVKKVMRRPSPPKDSMLEEPKRTPQGDLINAERNERQSSPEICEVDDSRVPSPRTSTWIDPIDKIQDEKEKEKKRQDLAMEQQQLVLRQVAAARALRKKEKQEQQIQAKLKTYSPTIPAEDEAVAEERRKHQQTRQSRTKGVLFKRLANGSLIRIDRSGNPLPKNRKDVAISDGDDEEDETTPDNESSCDSAGDKPDPVQKEFVPAPVPKVSAWKFGPPTTVSNSQQLTPSVEKSPTPAERKLCDNEPRPCNSARPKKQFSGKSRKPKTDKNQATKTSDQPTKRGGKPFGAKAAQRRTPRKQQVATSTIERRQ